MSCNPSIKKLEYSLYNFKEYLRADSLYYSRGFSDEEKVHKNLIYTEDDRMWFDRIINGAMRETLTIIGRHCPFEDRYGIDENKTTKTNKGITIWFNARDDLHPKENYKALWESILDFLRSYFLYEWIKDKNTNAIMVVREDYEKKKSLLLSAALNLRTCNKGKGRRGWW